MPWYVELARAIVGTILIFTGVAVVAAMFGVLLERKLSGWIQSRLGPKHVGPQGLLQTIADTIKLLQKENIVPRNADKTIFATAVVVVPLAALLDYVVILFGTTRAGPLIFRDLNVGVLYFAATSSLVVVGILMAGWGSNNKYALLGGLRSAAQMVSYEIPMGLALIRVAMVAGSLSTVTIVNAQRTVWFGVVQPVAFLIFLIAATAEVNRVPFDLVEAESELVAGYFSEYSGMRFALFQLGEYGEMFAMAAMAVTLFLGGWRGPVLPPVLWVRAQALRVDLRVHVGAVDVPAVPDRSAVGLFVESAHPDGPREPGGDGLRPHGGSPMIGEAIAFYPMAAMMLASGVAVVTSPNIVQPSRWRLSRRFHQQRRNTMRQMMGFNELRESSMWRDRR